jgi:hypothetical protein
LLMGVICLLIGYLWKRPHRQTQRWTLLISKVSLTQSSWQSR